MKFGPHDEWKKGVKQAYYMYELYRPSTKRMFTYVRWRRSIESNLVYVLIRSSKGKHMLWCVSMIKTIDDF